MLRDVVAQLPPPARQDPQKVFAMVPDDVRAAVPASLRGLLLADCTRAVQPPAGGGEGGGGAEAAPPGQDARKEPGRGVETATATRLPHTGAASLLAVPVGLLMVLLGRRLTRFGRR